MSRPVLDDLERDALTEIVNIGVSRAAASLRKMVGAQVMLSVPAVEVVSRRGATTLLGERESDTLVAVRQAFEGAFAGHALLIFPQATSLELVRAVSGGDLSPEELAELETEALAETGNVILNGCLASIANMLKRPLLFLYIDFSVRARDIHGYIAMLMDLPSLSTLRGLIAEFIAELSGDEEVAPRGG
jgi:chemotaxis protein CheC